MSIFLNQYTKDTDIHFNDIVVQGNEALTYLVGQMGMEGLIAVFSAEGNTVRTKRYLLGDSSCRFLNAVRAENGDFLIFGVESIRNTETAIVVRLNSIGKFIWSKRYIMEAITEYLQLIHLTKDEYVFGARIKGKGKTEDISLVKIDGLGNILNAVKVVPDSDERATGLVKTSLGFVVYGGSSETKDWDNFFIQFDFNLNLVWAKLVGNGDYQLTKHVLHLSDTEFIVTGEHGRTQESFAYRFDPNQSSFTVQVFDLVSGKDDGFKRLAEIKIPSAGSEFLIAAQVSENNPSTYTRLNNNLVPIWHKQILTDQKHRVKDLHIHDDGSERVRVCGESGQKLDGGLLFRTDDQLTLCKATVLATPSVTPVQYKAKDWPLLLADNLVRAEEIKLVETTDETEKKELCPRGTIDLSGETLVQSPFVYLQASGSDGSDDTPTGYHLRWDFRKILAEKHIAKGSLSGSFGLYPATYDFNKNDDFVKIYRTPFQQAYYSEIDFNTQPDVFNVGGSVREWEYQNINPVGVSGGITASIIISFPDSAAYDAQAALTNPSSSVLDFLKAYSGEIRVRLNGKPCFRIEWMLDLVNPADIANAQLRYEIVSLSDVTDNTSARLSERNILAQPDFAGTPVSLCEDIDYVRFDRVNAFTTGFRFYAYIDYLQGTNQVEGWQKINDFGLTLNTSIAYKRLENSPLFQINNLWPKFNEDNNTTGEFKVSVANYQSRWSNIEGLNYGVDRYLDLSQNPSNFTATETVSADPIGNLPDNSTMDISYFDIIQVAGLDYHFGRMFGFGHIDAYNNAQPGDQYIYLMEYDTLGDLEDGGGARAVKHIYMTPYLSIIDYKYPPVPVLLDPPTYGLTVDNGTPNPSLLTDDQGYTPFADIRFVNINREPFQFEKNFESFFQNATPFSLCEETETVTIGMEYALQGSPWVQPELLHDRVYNDNAGTPETMLIPNTGQNPVYRHQETEEGIHCYALYSVNWFSRPSDVSTEICTDYTEFPKRNTLLPPMNLAVQLVQSEFPPLLTTSQEQNDYSNITGDKTYLRVTFDYNYIHHQAFQFGNKAQFFFNKQEKRIVKGEILSVTQLTNNRVQITTGSYNILSTSPIQTVQPNIPPGSEDHFAESLFAVGGVNYRVESVLDTSASSGNNPTFILHQIRETNSVETPTGSNVWITTETYTSPVVGDRFLVSENMGNAKNWDNKLSKSIYLESFSTNDYLNVIGSTNNNGKYRILNSVLNGSDTDIEVEETIDDSITDGSVEYNKIHRVVSFNSTNNGFLIAGDVSSDFNGLTELKVFGSLDNDGDYTLVSVSFNGTNTDIVVNESVFLNSYVSCIGIRKKVPVSAYDTANSLITLAGDYTSELEPSYKETRQNTDGTTTELIMGGLVAECTIVEEPDVYNPDNVIGGANPGDPIPGSRTGVYTMTFTGNPLPPHVDPEVAWFQGKVRVLEDDLYLPTPLDSRTDARMKELNVQNVYEDSGNLVLIAVDATFQVDPAGVPSSYTPSGEYVPIATGGGIQVNYHPSYLLYLKVDETQIENGPAQNEFNEATILPAFGEGSRRTFLGIRALDGFNNDPSVDDCASHVGTPAAIVAQEIRNPEPPNPPSGPLYATRPDFYGKSTYTMDISFNNIPYSVLVYRANERKILDALYTPATVQTILQNLAAILVPDAYFTDRWNGLVNVVLESSGPNTGEFLVYPNSPFRFPIPDNSNYILPQSFTAGTQINPFNGIDAPGSGVSFNIPEIDVTVTMEQAVKDAITGAFVSQSKTPMIFEYIVNGDRTSNTPPVIRDENDNLIPPGGSGYNAFPFAVKLPSGNLRFCDYNLDGGSNSFYFYYAMELSDRQIKSAPSSIVGPIQLVNTRPAKEPSVKKVITQVENIVESIETAVCFKIEDYVASEGIERMDVYRATDAIDALSVRTMNLAAEIAVNGTTSATDICDTFTGLTFPLYGEDIHYRLIAMRRITLEDGLTTEYIPSEPSKVVRATLVDPNNPQAPCLTSENGITTATELQNVILKWPQVCYNGTYTLQKMNASGNWEQVYQIKSNEAVNQYPPIVAGSPDFVNFNATAVLPRLDENGNPIYHRFRVQVENSSGLFNLSDCPLTLATGCFDLQAVTGFVSYSDSNAFTLSDISTQEVDDGANNNPGQMTFTANIPASLPAGHNSFTQLDITVTDELGNTDTKTISTSTGIAVFNDGDGGLLLNGANHSYTIVTKLLTDFCTTGFRKVATLSYVHGPCNDLSNLEEILNVTDATHTYGLTETTLSVDDGTDAPVSLTFTDVSDVANLTIPQTFTSLEIVLTDESGNTDTKTIVSAGGSVTFNDGDGGLILNNGNLNRGYTITAKLITAECSTGQIFDYSLIYSFNPCNAVQILTDIVSYLDNSGASINPLEVQSVNNGVNHAGGSITISDIVSGALPAGHTFDSMQVSLFDGLGGFHTLPIASAGGSVTFNTGDGDPGSELDLGATNPNPVIGVEINLYTDLCTNGANFAYDVSYTYDPYEDLGSQTSVVTYADGNGLVKSPLETGPFNDGSNNNPGGSMIFTELISSNLPAGDTFGSVEITVQDGLGGTFTDTINAIGGSVTISNGQGGLVMNASQPNRTYTLVVKVVSTLCSDGVTFVYTGRYTVGL